MKRFWILDGSEKSMEGRVGNHEVDHQDITLVLLSRRKGSASSEQCYSTPLQAVCWGAEPEKQRAGALMRHITYRCKPGKKIM